MVATPNPLYPEGETQVVLIALRELFSRNRIAESFSKETLAELLFAERYISRRVGAFEVECALEALRLDGELLL